MFLGILIAFIIVGARLILGNEPKLGQPQSVIIIRQLMSALGQFMVYVGALGGIGWIVEVSVH